MIPASAVNPAALWPKRTLVVHRQALVLPEPRPAQRAMLYANPAPALILVAEDDAGDQVLIQEALETCRISKCIRVVCDGQEAVEYLFRSGRYAAPAAAPRPDLILLDLNMPRLGGREVAARLKADPLLKAIPIVAFTTSAREEDIASCYVIGINSYVQKPTDFDQFQSVLQDMAHYWLEVSFRSPRSH